jgi:hypothetical protein
MSDDAKKPAARLVTEAAGKFHTKHRRPTWPRSRS